MELPKSVRVALASLVFAVQFVVFSLLINEVWLGEAHEVYTFFRPDDDPRVNPGLGITTLAWSVLISIGYLIFGKSIRLANPAAHGAVFGLTVYVCFVLFQELFYYQFIEFEWIITLGALLHYLLAFTVGGALLGVILHEPSRAARPGVTV
jgi:hypothetical protein